MRNEDYNEETQCIELCVAKPKRQVLFVFRYVLGHYFIPEFVILLDRSSWLPEVVRNVDRR